MLRILAAVACSKLVAQRVGIHGKHHTTHKRVLLRGDIGHVYLSELMFDIIIERLEVGGSVIFAVTVGAFKFVVSNVIAGENTVSAVNGAVDYIACIAHHPGAVVAVAFLDFGVDALAYMEVHASFVLENAGLHAEEVVALAFLEVGVAATKQKFASLEIVVRVVFIRAQC